MSRLLAQLLEQPLPAPRDITLLRAFVAGLFVGLLWGALTRRAGFTRAERFGAVLVPAIAARALLSSTVLWPLGGWWDLDAPPTSHTLWCFSALGAVTVACGAGVGVLVTGLRAPRVERPAVTARAYGWLLAVLLVGCALEHFALYERFLHSYGELRCRKDSVLLKPCLWGALPRPDYHFGATQRDLVRQALWPSPPNPFVLPTGIVQLTDPQTRLLQCFGAAFELVLVLSVLLAATRLKSVRPLWQRAIARGLGGSVVVALVFAGGVVARSRAAGLSAPTTALLPGSDFRELVFIGAACVAGAGCLGSFLFARGENGARLAYAFGAVSALTVLRLMLDQAVAPDLQYGEFEVDIRGARFGVEMLMLGACALLLALGVFPWHAGRALLSPGAVGLGMPLVVLAALVLFVHSLAFARDGQIQFTRLETVDPRVARVKACRVAYAWRDPLWIPPVNEPGREPAPPIESARNVFENERDRLLVHLWRREEEHPRDRERVLGVAANLEEPAQNFRCTLVAAMVARAAVVVLAQELEELSTTLGPIARVADHCGAGRIELSEDETALPLDPHWSVRELLEQAREHRFNPELDPSSLPPGCR